ncbi:MAG: HAD-IIA family hydrolase [Candidatus Latescibacterota bacterium]|nr:HAD-IIA family hydrolase [Candidatus Latescibacterota bacterium]MEE2725689.1 HAD-IIA family hydrolase [Candidatus Latescibacterota bacterium]
METTDFFEVAKRYKVLFFDAYGVLKNSRGILEGIDRTFDFLLEADIDFYIVTNDASRSPQRLAAAYIEQGLAVVDADRVISSGMLATEYLRLKVKTGSVAYLGTEASAHYLQEVGLDTLSIADVDLDQCEDINALVFLDDEGFDWNRDINKIVNLLRQRNIPAIVANTDRSYPVSGKEVAVAIGGVADMVEAITGRQFIKFGKPDAQMFIFAYDYSQRAQKVGKEQILMVGDTLTTDILGGNKFGIDTALVLSGNTLRGSAAEQIHATGIIPDYICESAVIR